MLDFVNHEQIEIVKLNLYDIQACVQSKGKKDNLMAHQHIFLNSYVNANQRSYILKKDHKV